MADARGPADGYRLSWTTEYRDLRDAFAWNLFRRWRLMRYLRVALFAVVAVWIAATAVAQRISPAGGAGIVAIVVLLIVAPDLATWTFWRANAASLRRGSTGEVSASGLVVTNGAVENRVGWAEIGRLEQTRRVWLFRLAASQNLIMVPKRAVPGTDDAFAAYVRGRLDADNGERRAGGDR